MPASAGMTVVNGERILQKLLRGEQELSLMLMVWMTMLAAPFGADDTAWAYLQKEQTILLHCVQADIESHYQDDTDARSVAQNSVNNCAVDLDRYHVALSAAARSTAPNLPNKSLDMDWSKNVQELLSALEIRVLKLRGIIPKDR